MVAFTSVEPICTCGSRNTVVLGIRQGRVVFECHDCLLLWTQPAATPVELHTAWIKMLTEAFA